MEVIVVRHTETQNNVVRVIQGQSDSPLTEMGLIWLWKVSIFQGKTYRSYNIQSNRPSL